MRRLSLGAAGLCGRTEQQLEPVPLSHAVFDYADTIGECEDFRMRGAKLPEDARRRQAVVYR